MNVSFPFPRASFATAAGVVHADAHIGTAMDSLGDAVGAMFERRCTMTDAERSAEALIRKALEAMAHARNLLEPLMMERGQ
jgi:hypothetical protein